MLTLLLLLQLQALTKVAKKKEKHTREDDIPPDPRVEIKHQYESLIESTLR